MVMNQFVPMDDFLLFQNFLLSVFLNLLLQQIIEQVIATLLIHFEHSRCHNAINGFLWQVVDQVPVLVVNWNVLDCSRRILMNRFPLFLVQHFLVTIGIFFAQIFNLIYFVFVEILTRLKLQNLTFKSSMESSLRILFFKITDFFESLVKFLCFLHFFDNIKIGNLLFKSRSWINITSRINSKLLRMKSMRLVPEIVSPVVIIVIFNSHV